MFKMDKKALQEQFEAIAVQNCWNINKYPAGWDGNGDDEYVDEFVNGAWWAFQHQQAKVEELQKRVDVTLRALKRQSEDMLREARFYQDETHIERFGRQIKHIHDELEQALKGEG